MARFALLGAAGFVAPRHMKAIRDLGHELVAACDPHDSVGILDEFFPDAAFFTSAGWFESHLRILRRQGRPVDFVSICTPNHLHAAHVELALRSGAHAICEKPLVVQPDHLGEFLPVLEDTYDRRVYTVLQLRHLPSLQQLRERLRGRPLTTELDIVYVTPRGAWYDASWKSAEQSGGLAMNLGIHLFDLMTWLFGPVRAVSVTLRDVERSAVTGQRVLRAIAGDVYLGEPGAGGHVRFHLSTRPADLPPSHQSPRRPYRAVRTAEGALELDGFGELHTEVYRAVARGAGVGIDEARPAIELVQAIGEAPLYGDGALGSFWREELRR